MQIGENDIVIDIGANIGIFSLMAATKTNNKVYAFEPAKENIYYLRRNMKINNIKNVVENEVAVSNQVGSKILFITKNPAGHIMFDHNIKDKQNYIEVPTTTLQAIIDTNHIEKVDFLKMDCEGSEGDIFMSTPEEYLRKIKKISIEFHDNVSVLNHSEIREKLNNVGFVTKIRWDGKGPFGYIYAYNKYE